MLRPQASFDIYDPKSIEERRAAPGQCEEALQYGIRTSVDKMDDPVNEAYAGGLGPWGFKPNELKEAIERYLSQAGLETAEADSAGELEMV